MKKALLSFLAVLVLTTSVQASVWNDDQAWSNDWEGKYATWLNKEFKLDTFAVRPENPLSLPVSPIDAPYYSRALFAYLNHLPFVVRSATDSRKFVSNRSAAWDTEAEGLPRLRAFLKTLHGGANFMNLSRDSFPLVMTKEAVTPGAFYLSFMDYNQPEEAPAVSLLKDVQELGFMTYVVVPGLNHTRTLFERALTVEKQPSGLSGFMAFRWPNDALNGVENQSQVGDPRFSATAQYQADLMPEVGKRGDTFSKRVSSMISGTEATPEGMMAFAVHDLCLRVQMRVDWVNEALEFLAVKRAEDPNYVMAKKSREWEKYSTPVRDANTAELYTVIRKAFRTTVPDAAIQAEYAKCAVKFGPEVGQSLNLLDYRARMTAKTLSSDPNATLEQRWGVQQ